MKSILKTVLSLLILVGVIRGLILWNNDTGGNGAGDLVVAIVNGVADVTYRVIPWVLGVAEHAFSGTGS